MRDPAKVVWSSSYDRGLDVLLDHWTHIRKFVPEATLSILYGLDGSEAIAKRLGHQASIDRIARVRTQIRNLAYQGVTLKGRLPRAEQLGELFSAGVWAYPSWSGTEPFYETCCVSAQEAAAAGLRVVCTLRGGMADMMAEHAWLHVGGDPRQVKYETRFIGGVLEAMQVEVHEDRRPAMLAARAAFDLDTRVDAWRRVLGPAR